MTICQQIYLGYTWGPLGDNMSADVELLKQRARAGSKEEVRESESRLGGIMIVN